MRHEWENSRPNTPSGFMGPEKRRCKNCGMNQYLYKDQSWGRIVSRQWLPLVGRCNPEKRKARPKIVFRRASDMYFVERGGVRVAVVTPAFFGNRQKRGWNVSACIDVGPRWCLTLKEARQELEEMNV